MSKRTLLFAILGVMAILCAAMIGCSTNSATTGSSSSADVSDIAYYFPVAEGYKTVYEVEQAGGSVELVSFEVGKQVPFKLSTAYEWIITDESNNSDIGYLVIEDQDVYFYENVRATPEKILSLPLSPGASWTRFGSSDNDTTSIVTTYDGYYKDKLGGGGGQVDNNYGGIDQALQKSYPSVGGNDMTVEKIETVALKNGDVFAGAVRIRNSGTAGKSNFYWFAPGVGLTRYVIGASGDDLSSGEIVGELVDFGS